MAATDTTTQLLNRLRMRQVALLLAIDEHRTLHAASQQMGMTQPAATKMLHELEDALGQPLFDRVGRGLQLNPAGQAVMNTFRGMRGTMEALNRELQELRLGGAGKLFIGSIMAASPVLLTDSLIRLKEEYPLLAIEIAVDTSDRLVEHMREGTLDVVIGRMLGQRGKTTISARLARSRCRWWWLLITPWPISPVCHLTTCCSSRGFCSPMEAPCARCWSRSFATTTRVSTAG